MAEKYVGKRIKRTEDPRLIKGLAHYVDDIRLPDTLHVAFVRSIYAHARITGIDTTEALKMPGVVAVYTGKDIAEKVGPVPCAAALPGLKVPDYRVLATNKALFVGHPIAAVVATDMYAARDAAEVMYPGVMVEELPFVGTPIDGVNTNTLIHEHFEDNIAYKLTSGEGDIDAAMKAADKIVSQEMIHQRLAPDCDGAARCTRPIFPRRRRTHCLVIDADSAPFAHATRFDDRHSGKQAARDHAGSWRRFRIEAERLRGRSFARLDFNAAR